MKRKILLLLAIINIGTLFADDVIMLQISSVDFNKENLLKNERTAMGSSITYFKGASFGPLIRVFVDDESESDTDTSFTELDLFAGAGYLTDITKQLDLLYGGGIHWYMNKLNDEADYSLSTLGFAINSTVLYKLKENINLNFSLQCSVDPILLASNPEIKASDYETSYIISSGLGIGFYF